jgi:predicted RNA-binding Zn-ribbon protein involved in translation (DUF1610 family)
MQSSDKFSLLRTILRALGLSAEAVDDIIDRILDFLSQRDDKAPAQAEFPYLVRDDFLSPAEQSFYLVLKSAVSEWALVCPKVALGDLFYAKSSDPSKFRTFTNRIDRKHVDFLLCEPRTVKPLLGIELDDKSHQRADRQKRDEIVQQVFSAAKLPLVRVPVRPAYAVAELNTLLRQHVALGEARSFGARVIQDKPAASVSPWCPKCGSAMVLRTAKSGTNQGDQFWGCSNYPRCRGIVRYDAHGAQ